MNTKEKLLYTSWKKYIVLNDIDNNKTNGLINNIIYRRSNTLLNYLHNKALLGIII